MTTSKEKAAGKLFWIKNGSVSQSHFLASQAFLTVSFPDSLEVSGFLSAFPKAGLMKGSRSETGGSCSDDYVGIWTEAFIPHLILSSQQHYELQAETPFYSRGD